MTGTAAGVALLVLLCAGCTHGSGDADDAGLADDAADRPVGVETLSCYGQQHSADVLDRVGGARGVPDAAVPRTLARLSAEALSVRWPHARLAVAFRDDERLDAVADVASGRVAIYRFERDSRGTGWLLAATETC